MFPCCVSFNWFCQYDDTFFIPVTKVRKIFFDFLYIVDFLCFVKLYIFKINEIFVSYYIFFVNLNNC